MTKLREINLKDLPWTGKVGIFLFGFGCLLTVFSLGGPLGIPKLETTLTKVLVALVAAIVTTVLHELSHGLLFKLLTGKVEFGIKFSKFFGPTPYTTSSGSLLSRRDLQLVALAPQVLTALLLVILFLGDFTTIIANGILLIAALNLAGSCMDIYTTMWTWKFPSKTLFEDTQTGLIAYEEVESSSP